MPTEASSDDRPDVRSTAADTAVEDAVATDAPAPSRRTPLLIAAAAGVVLVGIAVWAFARPPTVGTTALTAPPTTTASLEPQIKFPDRTDPLPAPPFSVPALNTTASLPAGAPIDLAAFRGRPVVLNFWASWCGPCRREMPAFSDLAATYDGEVAFVGIATQDREKPAADFAREIDVVYPLGYDEGDKLTDAYGIFGLPSTYFIDGDGVILDARFGELTDAQMAERITSLFGVAAPPAP